MTHSRTRIGLGAITLVAAGLGAVATAPSASAAPDTDCMRAGMSFLKENGLFAAVAKGGLPIATAVSVGVTPRAGTDVASLPDPLPLSVVLADHRAGDDSLFQYPWC
ncbi:hypothetical protein ISU07_05290 [Nocardioides islandensis]|jgi:hypothetical protein|uniref:Uncharacterized protein n=1 Tax=Nocardioides islandensis TaxID=433663 RepID=A0A930VDD7_9ACTN|nr:hypothetical protein [Nocardioides islandensis]MBF4762531.1 hypothetical protein [Nocardioides islandensis]